MQITFIDATDFQVDSQRRPGSQLFNHRRQPFVYNAPSGTFSQLIFADPFNPYSATQTLSRHEDHYQRFEFDANSVVNLYIYATNGQSDRDRQRGSGKRAQLFRRRRRLGYSYLGDPFTGSIASCRALVGDGFWIRRLDLRLCLFEIERQIRRRPGRSSFTVAGFDLTLINFPQVYAVGAD